ncbi:MAG: hypothetical protein QW156_04175 [Candidatus Aenigmatarchaeota archaeon]
MESSLSLRDRVTVEVYVIGSGSKVYEVSKGATLMDLIQSDGDLANLVGDNTDVVINDKRVVKLEGVVLNEDSRVVIVPRIRGGLGK